MTTPLFLLRAVELGLFVSDLFLLTIGLVNDLKDKVQEWKDVDDNR